MTVVLEPAHHQRHPLHAPERLFQETNCYTDIWIEWLHARGLEPLAMLAYCTVVDFEGDQWTFFKPPPEDLARLYGVEIQELMLYRSIPDHIDEQLALGRTVIIEVDSFYLPDTEGRSYREQHEKTSIAVDSIDTVNERLRYFHGPGLFELGDDDYRNALRIGRIFNDDVLPPYVELVRTDRLTECPATALHEVAVELLRAQLDRRPRLNPVERFGARLERDLPALLADPKLFHPYAFATLRQCGSAWEAASSFLEWLGEEFAEPSASYLELAAGAKSLMFKLARAASKGRSIEVDAWIEETSAQWEQGISFLVGTC